MNVLIRLLHSAQCSIVRSAAFAAMSQIFLKSKPLFSIAVDQPLRPSFSHIAPRHSLNPLPFQSNSPQRPVSLTYLPLSHSLASLIRQIHDDLISTGSGLIDGNIIERNTVKEVVGPKLSAVEEMNMRRLQTIGLILDSVASLVYRFVIPTAIHDHLLLSLKPQLTSVFLSSPAHHIINCAVFYLTQSISHSALFDG